MGGDPEPPLKIYEPPVPKGADRCSERACVYPAVAGGGFCQHHLRMFGRDWPVNAPTERNVEAARAPEPTDKMKVAQALARVIEKKAQRRGPYKQGGLPVGRVRGGGMAVWLL
jgi:hypothetical protein